MGGLKRSGLDFNVKLLTGDFWKLKGNDVAWLPSEIRVSRKNYVSMLNSKFKERKFNWVIEVGNAVLFFTTDRRRQLVMTKL